MAGLLITPALAAPAQAARVNENPAFIKPRMPAAATPPAWRSSGRSAMGGGSTSCSPATRPPPPPAAFSAFRTITFEAANAAAQQVAGSDHPAGYSDHRALTARIHY